MPNINIKCPKPGCCSTRLTVRSSKAISNVIISYLKCNACGSDLEINTEIVAFRQAVMTPVSLNKLPTQESLKSNRVS